MERIQHFKVILVFVLLGIFLLCPEMSLCQDSLKFSIPFSKVAPVNTTTLTGASNYIKVKVPIPERWQMKKAVLNFSYVNSTALLQNRSRLVVWLNDHPVAQITLNPQLPQGKVSVNLPVNLLKTGYNDLNFTVAHHYTLECEDPSSPELWTTIEFDRASFDFEISLRKVPENLSAIANFLFDSRMFKESEINIVIPDKKEETVELATVVASSIALRFEYRPVKFYISDTIKKGMDNIILGNSEFIKTLTGDLIQEKGAILKIKAFTEDPYHAVLILKGDGLEDLKKSVYTFASLNFPFPKVQFLNVDTVKIIPQIPKSGKGMLFPGYEYSFKDVGFFNTNFKGIGAKSVSMDFKLPSDAFLKPNSFLSLKLNFSYGSGMRKDSTLNIQVNGKFVASIHLDNVKGGYIKNYLIDIPLSLFKPGYNLITFTAVLSPLITGYCEFVQTDNLQLTIFEDSKISVPSVPFWTALPNLNLLFTDGFPFSRPVDFGDSAILITDNSTEAISSAVNMAALLSQKAGYVPFKIKISYEKEKLKDKNVIAVGVLSKIPDEYLKAGNIKLQGNGSFVYHLVKHFEKDQTTLNTKLRSIIENILPIFKSKYQSVYSSSQINFSGKEEGQWLVLSQFESPHESRKTVVVIASTELESLLKGIYALWEPTVSGKSGGSLTVFDIQSPEETIASYYSEKVYYVGKMGFFSGINAWIYAHPVLFTIIMLIVILVLAYFILKVLKNFKRKRLSEK
ncbi:MAG: cellulose biosynthesis cyclic di-GMP-binding regulatory protein BcsB [Thermodesulfovibrio sp.]|nr:cellulose biosynthesis cyclic di-GMP-binding regulatory protein BcsB [Thermodesulfovibrio sp.]